MTDPTYMWMIVPLVALPFAVAGYALRRLMARARARDDLWEGIEYHLKERQTLAPRLTSIAALYFPWDHPLVDDVSQARKYAMAARTVIERAQTEAELSWALARLIQTASTHAELIRHADFAATVGRIASLEAKVAGRRGEFNRLTVLLQEDTQHLPGRLAELLAGVTAMEPFELDPLLARESMMTALELGQAPLPAT